VESARRGKRNWESNDKGSGRKTPGGKQTGKTAGKKGGRAPGAGKDSGGKMRICRKVKRLPGRKEKNHREISENTSQGFPPGPQNAPEKRTGEKSKTQKKKKSSQKRTHGKKRPQKRLKKENYGKKKKGSPGRDRGTKEGKARGAKAEDRGADLEKKKAGWEDVGDGGAQEASGITLQ